MVARLFANPRGPVGFQELKNTSFFQAFLVTRDYKMGKSRAERVGQVVVPLGIEREWNFLALTNVRTAAIVSDVLTGPFQNLITAESGMTHQRVEETDIWRTLRRNYCLCPKRNSTTFSPAVRRATFPTGMLRERPSSVPARASAWRSHPW